MIIQKKLVILWDSEIIKVSKGKRAQEEYSEGYHGATLYFNEVWPHPPPHIYSSHVC